jgi:hypothetical protein
VRGLCGCVRCSFVSLASRAIKEKTEDIWCVSIFMQLKRQNNVNVVSVLCHYYCCCCLNENEVMREEQQTDDMCIMCAKHIYPINKIILVCGGR